MYILRLRWSDSSVLLGNENIPFNKSGSPTHGEDVHTIQICRSHFLYKIVVRSSKISLPLCSANVDYSRSLHLTRKFRKKGNSPNHTCLGFCLFRKASLLSTGSAMMSTTAVIALQNPCAAHYVGGVVMANQSSSVFFAGQVACGYSSIVKPTARPLQ
jgi:hypothetical protein